MCIIHIPPLVVLLYLFFFNDTATTEIYTLSLHDALPISDSAHHDLSRDVLDGLQCSPKSLPSKWFYDSVGSGCSRSDRKSTRLNSSHLGISYDVFCLKKIKL